MKIQYVSFFREGDRAEGPLEDYLADLQSESDTHLTISAVRTSSNWHQDLRSLLLAELDILIVGCHGHDSRTGFYIGDQPVRWHELASVLKDCLPRSCSFIFYSCNGGYPGIGHMFYGAGGPDYIFGPYIEVDADAMKYAARQIARWKREGGTSTPEGACALVDEVNDWSKSMYSHKYDQSFLRVQWTDGRKTHRHPDEPGPDKPKSPLIPLKIKL